MIGVGVPPRGGEVDAAYTAGVLVKLTPKWWYDWRYGQIGQPGYVPMIWWLRRTEDNFVQGMDVAAANPNELWMLGNEPEMNGVSANEAGHAMRTWRRKFGRFIQTAAPGVNISLHRIDTALRWMDDYLAFGGPLPDMWQVHIYGPADAFVKALHRFQAWMRSRKVDLPIMVSEFAANAEDASALMLIAEKYIQSGIIERAAWFSAYWDEWNATGLLDNEGKLTEIGEIYTAERHTVYLPNLVA